MMAFRFLRRLSYLRRQRQMDADLAEELEFHREMAERELARRGHPQDDVSQAASRALGSMTLARDQSRDVWCPRWLQGIGSDVRLAFRSLRGTPVVTTVAVVSLALGIGANTAIFSIVNSLMLRVLPVVRPQQLVLISRPRIIGLASGGATWSNPVWEQIRQRSQGFDGMIAWAPQRLNVASSGETEFVDGLFVSGSYFDTLGVSALLGRTISDADDQRGGGSAGPVVVLSYGFWQRRFGGAADVIGHTLTLEHATFTIIGVTAAGFFGTQVGRAFDVALPVGAEPLIRGRESWLEDRGAYWLNIVVRLKAGQTLDTAQTTLRGMQSQIRDATMPDMPKPYQDRYLSGPESFALVPAATGDSLLRGRYARPLLAMLVVVVLVLLIACANIGNLLFARGAARRHELSVRVALGASRWRLARQLFTESALLAAIGAIVGVVFASWFSHAIVQQFSTQSRPVFLDLSIDGRVLMFTVGVGVMTALLFGTGPAFQMSRVAPLTALKQPGDLKRGHAHASLGSGLIVVQVALSVVLLVAAGLFVRTFAALSNRDPGFERNRVLLVNVNAQRAVEEPSQRLALYERVREAVGGLPGVADTALSAVTPVQGGGMVLNIDVSGGTTVPSTLIGGIANGYGNSVSPGWFHTFGITLIAGRDFTPRDRTGAPLVAIVNQALAREFLNGANPLGHTITLNLTHDAPREIVGVVTDALYRSIREPALPTVYLPLAQPDLPPLPDATVSLGVRSTGAAPGLLTKSIVVAVEKVSPNLTLTFRPLSEQVNASFAQERLIALLSGFFSGLGLLLAGLGLYGVTAYAVAGRRREIGIRMALGATAASVVQIILSRVSVQVVVGLVIGSVVSVWASQFIAALLYGLEPRDLPTLIGAAVILAAVAALAAWLPARRATTVDPMVSLRCD
jgi:putative ABC transport system permease protein